MGIEIKPDVDPFKLSIEDKIKLVRELDGLLIELLEGLEIEGDLDLKGCTSFTYLPNGLKVRGDLYLHECTSLTHLPNGLKVKGFLDLSKCTSLTYFPEGLKVRDLYLGGCTGLYHLKGEKIKGVKGETIWRQRISSSTSSSSSSSSSSG